MKYAADCELIAKAPKIGMFKVERPEIVAWDFEQYPRIVAAAKVEGEDWYTAVCLAGEAGLRVGDLPTRSKCRIIRTPTSEPALGRAR
jgi:hypothetical protein